MKAADWVGVGLVVVAVVGGGVFVAMKMRQPAQQQQAAAPGLPVPAVPGPSGFQPAPQQSSGGGSQFAQDFNAVAGGVVGAVNSLFGGNGAFSGLFKK